jgi:hypothetical protein
MHRLLLASWLALGACSSSQKEAEEPTGESGEGDDLMNQAEALGEEPSFEDRETVDPDSLPPTKPAPPAPAQDYEVGYGDCKALAGQYRRAWEMDEFKKLEKQTLNEKQRAQAESNVRKASQEAGDNWLSACEGLVGSPYPRDRLDCAMKAKSVKVFDDCWDGKAAEPAE